MSCGLQRLISEHFTAGLDAAALLCVGLEDDECDEQIAHLAMRFAELYCRAEAPDSAIASEHFLAVGGAFSAALIDHLRTRYRH